MNKKSRKPQVNAAGAAELFEKLSAADQAAIIQRMKDILAQKIDSCKKTWYDAHAFGSSAIGGSEQRGVHGFPHGFCHGKPNRLFRL